MQISASKVPHTHSQMRFWRVYLTLLDIYHWSFVSERLALTPARADRYSDTCFNTESLTNQWRDIAKQRRLSDAHHSIRQEHNRWMLCEKLIHPALTCFPTTDTVIYLCVKARVGLDIVLHT